MREKNVESGITPDEIVGQGFSLARFMCPSEFVGTGLVPVRKRVAEPLGLSRGLFDERGFPPRNATLKGSRYEVASGFMPD